MDPLDFLKVASSLCDSDDESERRTSIGRSYFALFNYLRLSLEPVRNVPTSDEAHRAVAYYLGNANNRDLASVEQSLRDLRVSRNAADYKLDKNVDHAASRTALTRAQRAVEKFGRLGNRAVSAVRAVPTFRSRDSR